MRYLLSLALVAGSLASATAATAAKPPKIASPPKLTGSITADGKITLRTASGARVTRVKPGWYTMVVFDAAANRNFRLKGPGVNKATGVKFRGTALWGVRLQKGAYRFQSDPQRRQLAGTFRVGGP